MISSNSNMPAMPISPASPNSSDPEWAAAVGVGLTKREHFAGLAMQSLISAIPAWEALGYQCPDHAETVSESYRYADLMTDELDKVQQ